MSQDDSGQPDDKGPTDDADQDDSEGYFKHYWQYATQLRTWFIAYGVGCLIVLTRADAVFNKPEFAAGLPRAAKLVALSFALLGLGAQVLLAFANKVAAWYVYHSRTVEKELVRHRVAKYFCESFWVDMVLDAATIGFYVTATIAMGMLI
jgi:hypothetical protein